MAPTRFFVQERIYDRFVAAAGEKAAALSIGDGLDPTTQMGPLANPRRVEAMEALASGLPVAAYPVTGPRDIIDDSGTGVLD